MKSIILLSGGLDSLVSLGLGIKKYNIKLAITFDYGQKSSSQEIQAAKNICKYYKIKHKVIKLNWLKKITHTSLVSDENVPTGKLLDNPEASAKLVWVPNRNGLFLNIAVQIRKKAKRFRTTRRNLLTVLMSNLNFLHAKTLKLLPP